MAAARHAMAAVMPTSSVYGVEQTGCTMIKSYSKHWACLFPQHGPGRKHQRKIELATGKRSSCENIRENSPGVVPFRRLAWCEPGAQDARRWRPLVRILALSV